MLDNLREDTRRLREIKSKGFPWYVLESLLFENGYQAVVLHRIAHWFRARRVPVLGPLVARLSLWLTGCDIAPAADLGPGLRIAHGSGLVIGDRVRVGTRALLLHDVTLGGPATERRDEMPVVGDDVFIAAGARVIGAIRVGHRVFIGANAVVTRDIPDDTRVVVRQELELRPRGGAAAGED